MIIASCTPFKPDPLKKDWGSFRQMRELADVVCVLCDCCHVHDLQAFTGIKIDDVTETHHNLAWEDYTNRLTLLARAAAHRADWVLWLDDDEILVNVTRKDILEEIKHAERHFAEAVHFAKREMWTETHYREDGLWKKHKVVLQRNPFSVKDGSQRLRRGSRLHSYPMQELPYEAVELDQHQRLLVHYGHSSPELRTARMTKYRLEDHESFSAGSYNYLVDETGMELCKL